MFDKIDLDNFIYLNAGVRGGLKSWIKKLDCNGDLEKQSFFKKKFLRRLKESPVAIETEKANEQHYEVPTDFFLTVSDYPIQPFPSYDNSAAVANEEIYIAQFLLLPQCF